MSEDPRKDFVNRCKICPFPKGTRCESGIPCNYNKSQGGEMLKNFKDKRNYTDLGIICKDQR